MDAPFDPDRPPAADSVERIGIALASARKRRRLTQQELADRAGVSRLTVLRAEAGHPGLALSAWISLLSALDPQLLLAVMQTVADDVNGRALAASQEALPRAVRRRGGANRSGG